MAFQARLSPRVKEFGLLALVVGGIAFLARLVPLLRGGGLTGLGNYDDGVYYVAGTALLHGLLPYRDYLLLHPPGGVVALVPFGVGGLLGSDSAGLAAARLTWMLLGSLNAVLVARILKPVGLITAAAGGLLYALAYPAIYIEWTPLLEGPPTTCLLIALLLLIRAEREVPEPGSRKFAAWSMVLLAGALLGAATTFKIWGVVPVATVTIWLLARRRWRAAAEVFGGALASATLICLPFFLAAPTEMWRMVVTDQLGRPRTDATSAERLADIVGLGLLRPFEQWGVGLVAALTLVTVLLAAATRIPRVRLCVMLTGVLTVLLLASPSWFLHYPGLVTGTLAVSLAAGSHVVVRSLARWGQWPRRVALVILFGAWIVQAAPIAVVRLGQPFPATHFRSLVADDPSGCVTSDNPVALVQLNVLSRDLANHCRFVADIGGYSYELATSRGHWTDRKRDDAFQALYLDYLRSGAWTIPLRTGELSSSASRETIASWPLRAKSGNVELRNPE